MASALKIYNANPKGKKTGDCAIRALSTALEQDYIETYKELFECSLKSGYMVNDRKNIARYLKSKGWEKQAQPKKDDGKKFTGTEFCKRIAGKGERIFVSIGAHHVVAVVDRKIYDTWDSSSRCVGNYWIKK